MGMNTRVGCKYDGSWVIDIKTGVERNIPCEHELYKETGYCVFHAPIEDKDEIDFWVAFSLLQEKMEELFKDSSHKGGNAVFLNCQGFIFPEALHVLDKEAIAVPVIFKDSLFTGKVDFSGTVFNETTIFKKVNFFSWANFGKSVFKKNLIIVYSEFGTDNPQPANFMETVFEGNSFFGGCRFYGDSVFANSVFKTVAEFSELEITGRLTFWRATFLNTAAFFKIAEQIERDTDGEHFFLSSLRKIKRPLVNGSFEQVFTGPDTKFIFKNLDLGGWVFVNTPGIELARFEDVTWKSPGKPKRDHTRDELLAKSKEISWEAVADVYRRLRVNYENKLAYGQAGDFFVGQMIAYRKHLLRNRSLIKWIFSSLYNIFSRYGESIWLPIVWLVGLFLLAAVCYWLTGYPVFEALRTSFLGFVSLNIDVTKEYDGWLIPSLQRILGIPLITLFILALRRAFRR